MADISDVEQALTDFVTDALYPSGNSQSSVIGSLCRVYRGWPNAAALNNDLTSGVVNVTVMADNDSGKTTTRYLPELHVIPNTPGTSVAVTANLLQIGGSPRPGDAVGALVNGRPFVYRVQPGDTRDQVAANLGVLIGQETMVAVAGGVITVHDAHSLIGRAVCDNAAVLESRRQEKNIRVICWCPDPSSRDAVAMIVDDRMSAAAFLPLVDGTDARISYSNTVAYDQSQNARLFRRDLIYSVEYPSITRTTLPSMLFGNADMNGEARYG